MYHNLFRVTLLCAAISLALTACGAVPTPTLAPITEAPIATEVVSTTTEIAPTNTPEPTATQVVLGVVAGTIAFVSNRDGNYEIYVMNGDGSELKNLTNNPADDGGEDYGPAWSPDGKRILFSSNRDGNAEIYVMNADGSGLINLTNAMASDDFFPKWSADGTQIGFTSGRDGNAEIYLMNADGSDKIPLTDSPGRRDNNMGARWSPDGMQIIYWSGPDRSRELYVMNADGSDQTRLTDDPADDAEPMLQP